MNFPALLGTFLFVTINVVGQSSSNVMWSIKSERVSDHEIRLLMDADVRPGWHLYSQHLEEGGPQPTEFVFSPSADFQIMSIQEKGNAQTYFDKLYEMEITWYKGKVEFLITLQTKKTKVDVEGHITYMTCNVSSCVPERYPFSIPLDLKLRP
ncbi:MAG: hypothetical protein KF763_15210 [Cyclobacteriaceae bacterium]|nr:hypothetical protein [Cyclobacteriaceae bacterium]